MIQEKIEIIRDKFKNASIETLPELMTTYREDGRIGVGKILERAQKKLDAYNKELDRVQKMLSYERQYGECGVICGIDEAGRGPLAGPVVAAAVILDINCPILYVNDSKKLSEKKREELYDEIMEKAVSVGVGIASPETIDEINILQADYVAMREAVSQLTPKPEVFLNDAVTIPGIEGRQVPIIKGDAKSLSIAAASIIAKVTRDRMEESERYCRKCELAKQYGGGLEEYLLRYLAQLTPEEQAEDVTYARRLACCGKCTWYGEHMCRACGCYVQLRAAVKGQNCPYEKWEQEGETHDTRSGNIL